MTKLKAMRIRKKMRLREIATVVKTTPQTVQQMEKRGIFKPSTAQKYAKAFPDCTWQDLIEDPKIKESFK